MNEAAVTTRMAHLHLRTGLPALARVELETLAGHGELGAPALADLAEARWRGGDLSGAAEAARAHLDQGGDQVLAEVVIIESLAAAGDHRDARRLAQRVLARADVDGATLDRVFAGHPRSSAWPGRREGDTSLAIAALTTGGAAASGPAPWPLWPLRHLHSLLLPRHPPRAAPRPWPAPATTSPPLKPPWAGATRWPPPASLAWSCARNPPSPR